MKIRRGFNLIELMVVIAIIAILASVALPMYSSFKKRVKVGMAVKVATQTTHVLQAFHDLNDSFTGITLDANDHLVRNVEHVGVVLGDVEGVTWGLSEAPTDTSLKISWAFDANSNCPSVNCDGMFCVYCPGNPLSCEVGIRMNTNTYGYDANDTACDA